MQPSSEITRLLGQARAGNEGAADQIFELIYEDLRAVARRVDGRAPAHTLQPTALVHEAWLKLAPNLDAVADRAHFMAVASRAMRQVLADHARARRREKRGGGAALVSLNGFDEPRDAALTDLSAFDESLELLEGLNARHARVVELRVFGGLTIDEAATELGLSHGTIESDWSMARAWLWRRLAPGG